MLTEALELTSWQEELVYRVKQAVEAAEGEGDPERRLAPCFVLDGPGGVGKTAVSRHLMGAVGAHRARLLAGTPHRRDGLQGWADKALVILDNVEPFDVGVMPVIETHPGVLVINGAPGLASAVRRAARVSPRVVHLVRVESREGSGPESRFEGTIVEWTELQPDHEATS